ncbi:hypothetical protein PIB30_065461 [Stylosanthes scabra]|uniref:Uncharacterized protein n=1 Tax=Stylosanthes scabra TaxID=79078 RepID=A0ABU6XKX7_9FABA|nr:hypothetical protein [Stylosanthes scabra]
MYGLVTRYPGVVINRDRNFTVPFFRSIFLPFFCFVEMTCCFFASSSTLLTASIAIAASRVCLSRSSVRAASNYWMMASMLRSGYLTIVQRTLDGVASLNDQSKKMCLQVAKLTGVTESYD